MLLMKKAYIYHILFALERYRLCGSKRCLQVRFKNKPFNLNVDSARLWIHVASRQNITRSTIKLYKVAGNRKKLLQISRSRSLRPGWYAMELITKHIIRITSTGESYMDFILEIESENRLFELSKKADVPFLELTTKTKIGKRKRRSAEENCTSKSACCRAEFVINFKDIGWDDWVVSPDKYNAYYCNGHCKNKYNYRHAGILQAATSQLKRKDVKVCCTPYKYSSLKLLYWNEGNMYEKVIDHMIVDECKYIIEGAKKLD
ncbi:inhibin beta A chain-like [Hydractinia symbiolongicarpus]|uniref:inhibin beta A chain-like n=1 Tax=Hydractinia symbiolongicarpus TaxID=13093 RepID=UPI00254CFC4C|nr:inhibin beta A chain-like [Hydractinia symbiolongicarpus]